MLVARRDLPQPGLKLTPVKGCTTVKIRLRSSSFCRCSASCCLRSSSLFCFAARSASLYSWCLRFSFFSGFTPACTASRKALTELSRASMIDCTPVFISSCMRFFLARCCLGQVPGGAPFSQRSEQATACTNRMQIRN